MVEQQNRTINLNMAEGPEKFLDALLDAIELMRAEGQDAAKILDQVNTVTGFFMQDREIRTKFIN